MSKTKKKLHRDMIYIDEKTLKKDLKHFKLPRMGKFRKIFIQDDPPPVKVRVVYYSPLWVKGEDGKYKTSFS